MFHIWKDLHNQTGFSDHNYKIEKKILIEELISHSYISILEGVKIYFVLTKW